MAEKKFQNFIFLAQANAHPLIYMRGVKSEDLGAIIDFLYRGEANVSQENLDSFLATAEELKLKGLMGQTNHEDQKPEEQLPMELKLKSSVRSYQDEESTFRNMWRKLRFLCVINVEKSDISPHGEYFQISPYE